MNINLSYRQISAVYFIQQLPCICYLNKSFAPQGILSFYKFNKEAKRLFKCQNTKKIEGSGTQNVTFYSKFLNMTFNDKIQSLLGSFLECFLLFLIFLEDLWQILGIFTLFSFLFAN